MNKEGTFVDTAFTEIATNLKIGAGMLPEVELTETKQLLKRHIAHTLRRGRLVYHSIRK